MVTRDWHTTTCSNSELLIGNRITKHGYMQGDTSINLRIHIHKVTSGTAVDSVDTNMYIIVYCSKFVVSKFNT